MFLGLLLLACPDPTSRPPAVDPPVGDDTDPLDTDGDPDSDTGPEGPTATLSLLAPRQGFVYPEGVPLQARAAVDGAPGVLRWTVNGTEWPSCPAGEDALVCEVGALKEGDVRICVEADGVGPACAEGSVHSCVHTSWYPDDDGDGYGTGAGAVIACEAPAGTVRVGGDCDDTDATVHPGAAERCDGRDDDCDSFVDDGATDAPSWYPDRDRDGHGTDDASVVACVAPLGHVEVAGDCDDGSALVGPHRPEVCNGGDDDCDGRIDVDAVDAPTFFGDADADGYGDPTSSFRACVALPGSVGHGTDCDDADAAVHPGAIEHCDDRDEDCDGARDDAAVDAPTWYADRDADGYGDASAAVRACAALAGTVASPEDCDDTAFSVNPSAAETCDGADDDCDGTVDEPDALDAATWYLDTDADGFGDAAWPTLACEPPVGSVSDASDCDDTLARVWPGAAETCDGLDEDCDGVVDGPGPLDPWTWYQDADGDGFGDATVSVSSCDAPGTYVTDATDCDDADATVSPGTPERLDGGDDDCDGQTDEVPGAWATDLVANGDFEAGDLTGWTRESGPCEVVADGVVDWITPYEGDYMLFGGTGATTDCLLSQSFDLQALGFAPEDLDSGRVAVDALAVLANERDLPWHDRNAIFDRTMLRLRYLDESDALIGSVRTLLSEDEAWELRGTGGVLPVGTRRIALELEGALRKGPDIDSVADSVSLSIVAETPSSPSITRLPFLQDYRQDAMRLFWETDANLCAHQVEWGPTGGALDNVVTLVDTVQVDASHFVHVATIEGLTAATEYDYRVRSGDTVSETFTFRTAPAEGEAFQVGWMGDNEWGTPTFTAFLHAMLTRGVDLYMSPGDVVWDGDEVADWHNEWLAPLESLRFSQTRPVLFARGNHDNHHALSYAYSALPDGDDWYSFSYGNVFFVVLDSNAPTDSSLTELSQMQFLEDALSSEEALLADFRVVTFHNPPYTNARHDDAQIGNREAQSDWVPLFEDHDVDLVIGGHFHSYQRGTNNDVTYVIVGGGGGWLDDREIVLYPFFDVVETVHHYAMMEVDGPTLTWTAYDTSAAQIDTFTLSAD